MLKVPRRQFVAAAGASLPIAGLTPASVFATGDVRDFDRVIVAHLETEMLSTHRRVKSRGYVAADDVHAAFSSSRLMFAHFEERGMSGYLDREVKRSKEKALDFAPSGADDVFDGVKMRFEKYGVTYDPSVLRDAFAMPRERKEEAARRLEAKGVSAAMAEGLMTLAALEDHLIASQRDLGTGRLVTMQASENCQELAVLIAELVVLDGLLWLGGIVIPPYEVAAALLAMLIGALSLMQALLCP